MAEMIGKHVPELLETEVDSQMTKQKCDWVIIISLGKQAGNVIVFYSESIVMKVWLVWVTLYLYCSVLLDTCSYY